MHVADPRMFWKDKKDVLPEHLARGWWYGDKGYLSFEELHQEVYQILEKFPKLKLIAAHFFFLSDDVQELTRFFERWENTAVDLTPAMMNLVDITHAPEVWKPFFEKYRHRIFFGSDNYLYTRGRDYIMQHHTCQCTMLRQTLEHKPEEAFQCNSGKIIPLDLPDDILQDIYYNNHARLYPHARTVNGELILQEVQRLLQDLEKGLIPHAKESEPTLEEDNLRTIQSYFSAL
jgi:predicted TIM-barrel fold metal-dependent hydrolase